MSRKEVPKLIHGPPASGDEIVISGIAGRFPSSRNMEEFKNNLMNKVDLITSNCARWDIDHPEIPKEAGLVDDVKKFDSLFFGILPRQAISMDPMGRLIMEHAYEAVFDAGINPKHLRGSNTGVIIGVCSGPTDKAWLLGKNLSKGAGVVGRSKSMLANRISYAMCLHGPSYAVDSACSSSMLALNNAFEMIQSGQCDRVIVGGSNLCLVPDTSLEFWRLGVLSPDCRCKCFDEKANGYVRSEAICLLLLERASLAKRAYATVCYTMQNCDGYKEQGITYPASEIQRKLFEDFYEECKISPTSLAYMEAHGTGTAVGDPEELTAIGKVFIEGRTTPLKIGSVKSNIGHTEPASGICSIAKVIIGIETGLIPPNMHFNTPKKGVKYFEEGRLQVVTEPTPWEGGYVGINSFGFGGANVHVLLKSNTKEKVNNGAPNDDLPRLVVVSGREKEAVSKLLDTVENKPVDVEYIGLLHNIYCEHINGYMYRGYTIAGPKTTENSIREIQQYPEVKRPIWFVFSGMGSQWHGMGEALLRLPIFRKAIKKCDAALRPRGIDIFDIITNKDTKTFDNILNSFVGIAAVQIGLVDLLTSVGIQPDNIIGHSVGELGCAYADGCFTAEEMILAAYSRGLASVETETIRGSMAAVGLGYEEVKDLCPSDIEVACHNGPGSCTISGPAESMKKFVEKLQAENIFAREVPCSNIAYHSRYIAPIGPKLLVYLKKVIPNPKPRSSKWLSTSVPRSEWSKPEAKLSSAEYHTNNLLSSVLFAETATSIPENAVTIEIAPHGLLQAILKRSLHSEATHIALTQRGHKDNVEFFLKALGKLYNAGLEPQLANLYPPVEFPVSRGTPMISPHIKWEHSTDWPVESFMDEVQHAGYERTLEVSLDVDDYEYMAHHVIDGRNLLPAMGYIVFVWETFIMVKGRLYSDVSVVFENVKFERATNIPKTGSTFLTISIHRGSGKFEVADGDTTVASGTIRITSNPVEEKLPAKYVEECDDEEHLDEKDIYKEFGLRGYQYTGPFRALRSASITGTKGHIEWANNFVTFMDNMLQIQLLSMDTRSLFVPTSIRKITIDAQLHKSMISNASENNIELPVYVYKDLETVTSGGIEIREINANVISRRKQRATPVLEEYKFVAHRDNAEISISDMVTLSTHLALDDCPIIKPRILELLTVDDAIATEELLYPVFLRVLGDLPRIQPSVTLVAKSESYDSESLPSNVTMIEPEKLLEKGTIFIAAGYNIFTKKQTNIVDQLLLALMNDGFLLTREDVVDEKTFWYAKTCGLNVILQKRFRGKSLLLLKKEKKCSPKTEVVYLDNYKYDWLEKVQAILKDESLNIEDTRLILVAEGDLENGALGLVKCLTKEHGGQVVRSVIVQDKNAPKFSLNNPLYAKQLELNISFNVLRPGNVWGTYRHLPLPPLEPRPVFHSYANVTIRGDLNSIIWQEGKILPDISKDSIVHIAYGSLNFRDIMLATGKLPAEAISKTREAHDCLIGLEYSGVTPTGRRVMGMVESRGLSNICVPDPFLQWDVPDHWTLEEAATIPVVYATAFMALNSLGKIQKGDKVLIHAGSGGLGQAAINIALFEGCEVFTTVGTPEKRKFIRETFPSIDDDHIGNSRDTSFEQMISKGTNGTGVDIVLNSLAEEKLLASMRCLGIRGRFLEVGKFDIAVNTQIGLGLFRKELSFHSVMLDNVISGVLEREKMQSILAKLFLTDAVKPLARKCFKRDEIEAAFRYMAAGKHVGKVLIKIHEDNEPLEKPCLAYPCFHAAPNKNYVIVGGLGGLGLEMTDWLVLRGAKYLTLISRSGIRTGYQRMRTELWKSYGVNVRIVSDVDASKTDDCESILKSAEEQAPVDGIFNLAALLRDGLFVNQTAQTFEESLKPKMLITKRLDELSRKICPQLRHFVVFSSISCGRGNFGQTNYGLGNAVMERICERRVSEGLPGLAIQWGAVGDVGLAVEMLGRNEQLDIGGTLQQRITSCLEVLDHFLTQDRPIVSSMVVAEKRAAFGKGDSVIGAVLHIMGLKDLKGVNHNAPLSEMGMDSMTAVEIKQTLERDFDIMLTPQDIRHLNIAKLLKLSAGGSIETEENSSNAPNLTAANMDGMNMLFRTLDPKILSSEVCFELAVKSRETENEVFFIPGIEGVASIFTSLAEKLTCPAVCFQLSVTVANTTIEEMAETILPYVLERNKGRRNFTIVAYSYGSLLAIEVVRRLENHGLVGRLILVDGAPDYLKAMRHEQISENIEEALQMQILLRIAQLLVVTVPTEKMLDVAKCDTWEKKLDKFVSYTTPEILKLYSHDVQKDLCRVIYNRVSSVDKYDNSSSPPIKTPITLLKPTNMAARILAEDYGLGQITQGKVDVHTIEGDHATVLDNEKVAAAILAATATSEE